jgi:hypothetical protein
MSDVELIARPDLIRIRTTIALDISFAQAPR